MSSPNLPLAKRKILLGVTGGIAAYKAADLCSQLVKGGAEVTVIMTPSATQFVAPLTFATLSANDVFVEQFASFTHKPSHITLAKRGEIFVIAPLTANTLAKIAHGIADNLLTSTILAAAMPIILAPAMNSRMWKNPATQENLQIARSRGYEIIAPKNGRLACGEIGEGRMAEAAEIFARCVAFLSANDNFKIDFANGGIA